MSLVINYYVLCIISIFAFAFGIDTILTAYIYTEERADVIINMILGIIIISVTITNFIFYIKRHLVDYVQSDRIENDKKNVKIGEILELIGFSIFIFTPIWRIPFFLEIKEYKQEFVKQIIISIFMMIASIFLIYELNPLDIKNKIKRKVFYKKIK